MAAGIGPPSGQPDPASGKPRRALDPADASADTHPDSGCGIKILHRTLFLQLPFFNHMHRFMPSLVKRHGGMVIGVDVAHRARLRGTSKYRILDRLLVGISDIFGVIWLLRRAPRHGEVTEMTGGTDGGRT